MRVGGRDIDTEFTHDAHCKGRLRQPRPRLEFPTHYCDTNTKKGTVGGMN